MRLKISVVLALFFTTLSIQAQSIVTRERVMQNARTFRDLTWTMASRNAKSACLATTWIQTPFTSGTFTGMAYNWGGMSSISEFANGIAGSGFAGNRCTELQGNPYGFRPNTFGVDCSGLTQQAFQYGGTKLGTYGIRTITNPIALGTGDMRSGDVFVKAGDHVAIFSQRDQSGNPVVIEASATDWKVTQRSRTWSYFSAYEKRRYYNLQDAGMGAIYQGETVSQARLWQWFTTSFRLLETTSSPITYDDLTVAILDQNGQYKFDLQHRGATYLGPNGIVSVSLGGYANIWPGWYRAVARGRIGSTWSDLPTAGGTNGVWFYVSYL